MQGKTRICLLPIQKTAPERQILRSDWDLHVQKKRTYQAPGRSEVIIGVGGIGQGTFVEWFGGGVDNFRWRRPIKTLPSQEKRRSFRRHRFLLRNAPTGHGPRKPRRNFRRTRHDRSLPHLQVTPRDSRLRLNYRFLQRSIPWYDYWDITFGYQKLGEFRTTKNGFPTQ